MISLLSGVFSVGFMLFHSFISAVLAILGLGSSLSVLSKDEERSKNRKTATNILIDGVLILFLIYRKHGSDRSALKESGKKVEIKWNRFDKSKTLDPHL